MDGETIDRHPGEHARPGSPPGWYADPVKGHSLRRWDGEHWTAEVDPRAAVAEFQPSAKLHAVNWPVLAATLVAAWYAVSFLVVLAGSIYATGASEPEPWVGGAFWKLSYATMFFGPPIVVLLGLLGTRRRYSTASRIWAVVPLLIGAVGFSGMVQLRLPWADPGVESVAFGVVGGRTVLAGGSWDGTVQLWDPATGEQIGKPLTGHKKSVESVAFGVVDGRTVLASGSEDRTVRLWDPATGKQIGEPLTGHKKPVNSVAFGVVDGRTVLASGSDDKTVRLWDPATGKQIGERLTGHDGWVVSVAFGTVDGRTVLASGGDDGKVRLWDPATGEQIGEPLTGHQIVESVAFGVVEGRTVLASGGGYNGKVLLWDPATGKQIRRLTSHDDSVNSSVKSVAFGRVDGRTVLASDRWDDAVWLWDPATGKQIGRPLSFRNHRVHLVAFGTVDGRTVLASGNDGKVLLWDPATGKQIRRLAGESWPF